MMNILYICWTDPRQKRNGSEQRTHFIWKALCSRGEVYTTILSPRGETGVLDSRSRIYKVGVFQRGIESRVKSLLYTHYFKPTTWPWNFSYRKQLPIKDVRFDLVVNRYLQSVCYSRSWEIAPTLVDVDDFPIEVYETSYAHSRNVFFRCFSRMVVLWWQNKFLSKCAGVWTSNIEQQKYVDMEVRCQNLRNIAILPEESYRQTGYQKFQLMTVGLLDYAPNYKGISNFLDNIWRDVIRVYPDLRYKICGRRIREIDQERWSKVPNVDVLGSVENIDKIYEESLGVVAPIDSGGGTCIKVIESAMHGRICFCSDFAKRGLSEREVLDLGVLKLSADELIGAIPHLQVRQNGISERAKNMFSYEKFVNSVVGLIKSIG